MFDPTLAPPEKLYICHSLEQRVRTPSAEEKPAREESPGCAMTGAHPGHNRASTHGVRMRGNWEGLGCGSLSAIERATDEVPAAAAGSPSGGDNDQAAASPTLGEVADLGRYRGMKLNMPQTHADQSDAYHIARHSPHTSKCITASPRQHTFMLSLMGQRSPCNMLCLGSHALRIMLLH